MKKFINPLPAGLMPVFKSDLVQIQDNAFDALISMLKGVRSPNNFVVSGMDVTSAGAGLINISAGYWFRISTGELYKFAGISSAAYPCSVAQGGMTVGTKTYKDGSVQNVTQDLLTQVQQSVIISGSDAIVFNSDTTRRLINQQILNINLNSAWANVAFQNSWSNNGAQYVQYRKNTNGLVMLRGRATHSGAATSTIFTLPAGFRPTRDINIIMNNMSAALLVFIGADGTVVPASATDVVFDGVSFTVD